MSTFVVRCRYVANGGEPEGVGYLTKDSGCHRDLDRAATFDTEADAWAHASMSGERVPDDCWVEPKPDELRERLRAALTAKDKPLTKTAEEMRSVRLRCEELGISYNRMLTEVCQALSAERKKA